LILYKISSNVEHSYANITLGSRKRSAAGTGFSSTTLARIYYPQNSVRNHIYQLGHILIRFRQPGQGGDADSQPHDLRAELLKAEAAHYAKKNGTKIAEETRSTTSAKRALEDADEAEDEEKKRRRLILEEAQDLDADSAGSDSDTSDEE